MAARCPRLDLGADLHAHLLRDRLAVDQGRRHRLGTIVPGAPRAVYGFQAAAISCHVGGGPGSGLSADARNAEIKSAMLRLRTVLLRTASPTWIPRSISKHRPMSLALM